MAGKIRLEGDNINSTGSVDVSGSPAGQIVFNGGGSVGGTTGQVPISEPGVLLPLGGLGTINLGPVTTPTGDALSLQAGQGGGDSTQSGQSGATLGGGTLQLGQGGITIGPIRPIKPVPPSNWNTFSISPGNGIVFNQPTQATSAVGLPLAPAYQATLGNLSQMTRSTTTGFGTVQTSNPSPLNLATTPDLNGASAAFLLRTTVIEIKEN